MVCVENSSLKYATRVYTAKETHVNVLSMASYERLVLPGLQHTNRPTRGPKEVSLMYRVVDVMWPESDQLTMPWQVEIKVNGSTQIVVQNG